MSEKNQILVESLKKISDTKWKGTTIHINLDNCLTAINLSSCNSGWYKPTCIKINGLNGLYMVNQDGSLFCESRIIKEDEDKYRIESLTSSGWNEFERIYGELLDKLKINPIPKLEDEPMDK